MDKAYIAGLFDGEGCCLVSKDLKQFSVKITNSDKLVLDELPPLYGGHVGLKSKKEYGYKTIWDWRLYQRERVFKFLCDLLPHAEIKKTQILCYLSILADVMRGFTKTKVQKENLQWCYDRFVAIRIGDRYAADSIGENTEQFIAGIDGGSSVVDNSGMQSGANESRQTEEAHESPAIRDSRFGDTFSYEPPVSRVRPVLTMHEAFYDLERHAG